MPQNDLDTETPWIPAFAGMTEIKLSHASESNLTTLYYEFCQFKKIAFKSAAFVIPAKAGIQMTVAWGGLPDATACRFPLSRERQLIWRGYSKTRSPC